MKKSLLALPALAVSTAASAAEGVSYNYVEGGYTATNTTETPELDALAQAVAETDAWYQSYVAAIAPEASPEPEEPEDQGVSAELAAVQADIDARAEALHQQRAAQEGTTENLYAERVAGVFVPEEDAPAPRRHAFEPIGPVEDGGDGRDYTPGA